MVWSGVVFVDVVVFVFVDVVVFVFVVVLFGFFYGSASGT